MAESEEELKSFLVKVKEESEKVGLNLNIQKTQTMASGLITSWQIDEETVADFILGGSKITADDECSHEIKRPLSLGRKVMTNLDSILKSRDIANKGPSSQGYVFSNSHICMWELDYKESWAQNWCFWTVVLEKTLESPLDCKEIKPVHPKGNQSWISIGRTDVEAETPILWLPHVKNWLIWKYPNAGKDWGQEENGTTEDEMVGWHHWLNGHEFGWTPGVSNGQGGLVCCSPLGRKESDTTEQLNWTESRANRFSQAGHAMPSLHTHWWESFPAEFRELSGWMPEHTTSFKSLPEKTLRKPLQDYMINSWITTILRECKKTWDVKRLTSSFPRQ